MTKEDIEAVKASIKKDIGDTIGGILLVLAVLCGPAILYKAFIFALNLAK